MVGYLTSLSDHSTVETKVNNKSIETKFVKTLKSITLNCRSIKAAAQTSLRNNGSQPKVCSEVNVQLKKNHTNVKGKIGEP